MNQYALRIAWLCTKIMIGSFLGAIMILVYASYSTAIRHMIQQHITTSFHDQFSCNWNAQIEYINLVTLELSFTNVSIHPCNQEKEKWSLYADKFILTASWIDLITKGFFSCSGSFYQTMIHEDQYDHRSYFSRLLVNMFSSDLPGIISFNYIAINQSQWTIYNSTTQTSGSCDYSCQLSRESDGLHIKLHVTDGNINYKNKVIVEKIIGCLVSIIPYSYDYKDIYTHVDAYLTVPTLQDKGSCFCKGDIYAGKGAFVIANDDQSCIIEPLKIDFTDKALPFSCAINLQSDILQKICMQQLIDEELKGNLSCALKGNLAAQNMQLDFTTQLSQAEYKKNSLLDKAYVRIYQQDDHYHINLFVGNNLYAQGSCTYQDSLYHFTLQNTQPIASWLSRYWYIPQELGQLSGKFDIKKLQADGHYTLPVYSDKLAAKKIVQGAWHLDTTIFTTTGTIADTKYQATIGFLGAPHLVKLYCADTHQTFIDLHEHQDPTQGTVGFVGFNTIKNMIADSYKSSFWQPGQFDLQGQLKHGAYHAKVSSSDAHIRIPFLYNVIQDITGNMVFDFVERSMSIDQMMAHLYQGSIECQRAVAIFADPARLSFLYAPLFFNNILLSWNKGIFGTVSGTVLLNKQIDKPLLMQGTLLIDKAQLKGNIFSQEFQEQLQGTLQTNSSEKMTGDLDITIASKEPILVETAFLKAMIHADLHIKNKIENPLIEGVLLVTAGQLNFPYTSLEISHGQIALMPKQSTQPSLELVAKGKIKRYNITMHATGTTIDQQIHFESSPYLTEEQIISLLLVGSHDNSLTAVMPAVFMQKIQELVFGPALSKSKLDILFARLLQSFKNIRIFPQFSNQTGRGGVRGVIEVDATDRLQGRIDSNLMQLEDTIFEADYLITDDVTIRAIKDGPSTYGGEVEMRWKFS